MLLNFRAVNWAIFIFSALKCATCYKVETDKQGLAYLEYYGYVDPKEMPVGFTLKDCDKKLKEFQELAHVKTTGKLDSATLEAMNTPRCGCPDFIHLSFKDDSYEKENNRNDSHTADSEHGNRHHSSHHHHHHHHHHQSDMWNRHNGSHSEHRDSHRHFHSRGLRSKRFVLSERRWDKTAVTYNIVQYPTRRDMHISTRDIQEAIQKAFNIWEQHINLEFIYQPNNIEVDIEISFVSGHHGDRYPFDGPGRVLAHAFFPGSGMGGDVHFEQDEDWGIRDYNKVDVLFVAVHEIGHSLGLGHSSTLGAIMYPMYGGYSPNLQLHQDDILGVQALYGRRNSAAVPTTSRPNSQPTTSKSTTTVTPRFHQNFTTTTRKASTDYRDLCEDSTIDAVTTMLGDTILVFKGMYVYEIGKNGEGILPGWPKRVDTYFQGLEGHLDCVVTRSNGKTYFFKDKKYWRFTGRQMDRGYPRSIANYFPGIPNNLDAAFEWDGNFMFVKEDKFWAFNTKKRPQIEHYFPIPVSHWGLSKHLDAAFTAPNGTVFFFQGIYNWEFDKNSHEVNARQGPANSFENWFGCMEP